MVDSRDFRFFTPLRFVQNDNRKDSPRQNDNRKDSPRQNDNRKDSPRQNDTTSKISRLKAQCYIYAGGR